MSIVITTPTGKIGSRLAELLLQAGKKVTLLARHPEKVARLAAMGATVKQGSLNDAGFVREATQGAKALFWLTPPNVEVADFRAYQRELGRIAAEAIQKNGIAHVVHLSSLGAHLGSGTGPVNGLHDIEKILDGVAANVTHLRPAAFYENILGSLETMKQMGALFQAVSPAVRVPMIATRDIAEVAAKQLADLSWSGRRVLTFFGPEDLSYSEIAAIISREIRRPIEYVQVSPDQVRDALVGLGISADVAGQYVELAQAFDSGLLLKGLTNVPDWRTSTSFAQFTRDTIGPALGG